MPAAGPSRVFGAAARDLPFAAGPRKRPDVYLCDSGLGGSIGDPATVGRESRVALIGGRAQEQLRFPGLRTLRVTQVQGDRPKILTSVADYSGIRETPAIGGEGTRNQLVPAFQKLL